MEKIKGLSEQHQKLWEKCAPLLAEGRARDLTHAKDLLGLILDWQEKKGSLDLDVLIPVAMMHDIGHSSMIDEHFREPEKQEGLRADKLPHMITGSRIAEQFLTEINYDPQKAKEVIELVKMHDYYWMNGEQAQKAYDTNNKKAFHDLDVLVTMVDKDRLKKLKKICPNREEFLKVIGHQLNLFFFDEFKNAAKRAMHELVDYQEAYGTFREPSD